MSHSNRREMIRTGVGTCAVSAVLNWPAPSFAFQRKKLPVAAVVTVYKQNSHADVIVGKILAGFRQDGGQGPDLELASMYVEQTPANDLSRSLSQKYGFRICNSIDEALTLGSDKLAVSGVLSIGEHGEYGYDAKTHQHLYPRRRFFDAITATFRRVGQTVPVFNDKHLSFSWSDAEHMVTTAKQMKFPLIAGSSVPVAHREPLLELPRDCEIEEAVSVGYGGLEAYGFHALEGLQCMIERRRGGETGVSSVQAIQGMAIDEAQQTGRWSAELLDAALQTLPASRKRNANWKTQKSSAVYLIKHRDGLKSAVVMANGVASDFAVAVKLKGITQPLATWYKLEDGKPYGHFAALLRAIEHTVHNQLSAYPVERTLLTTGILDRVMHSLAESGKEYETPELDVRYVASDWPCDNAKGPA